MTFSTNNSDNKLNKKITLNKRFRGYLPIIVDIETAGFNADKDAMLEIAFIFVEYSNLNNQNIDKLVIKDKLHFHIKPFNGANLDKSALEFNKIDPYHPFRFAVTEQEALSKAFAKIQLYLKKNHCNRAILVGHNPNFDLSFLTAAINRCKLIKQNPFHKFTTLDTATMGVMLYNHTVLAKISKAANINFDEQQAHSALYDAEVTAEIFCKIVNICDGYS